jgi:hypothetical protein
MRVRCGAIGIAAAIASTSGISAAQTSGAPNMAGPAALATGPSDPIAYYMLRRQVGDQLSQQNDSLIEPSARRLTEAYPRDGLNWIYLGAAARRNKAYSVAASAYERAGTLLGWQYPYWAGSNAAANWLLAGDTAAALRVLRMLVFDQRITYRSSLYDDPAFAALRGKAEFQAITGRVDVSQLPRTDGWRYDVDFLAAEVARASPDYRGQPLPSEFTRRRDALKEAIPRLSDEEILVGLNRMLASLHQGHTGLWGMASGARLSPTKLPVQLYAFQEGLFVIDASEPHRNLIGTRLVAIEGTPAESALARVNELQSADGDMEYLQGGPLFLAEIQVLRGLGIIQSTSLVHATFRRPDGRVDSLTLKPEPMTGREKLIPPPNVPTPLYLSQLDRTHWTAPLDSGTVLYMQVNQIANGKDEGLPAFGARVRGLLADTKVRAAVVDLRHNDGGSTSLYIPLLRALIEFGQGAGRQLYVLTSRTTYSAASNFITDLEYLVRPIFVGEPASECCNLHGDAATVVLPFSKLRGRVSTIRWNRSVPWDERRELNPAVPVFLSAQEYFGGRDPVLDAALKLIRASH